MPKRSGRPAEPDLNELAFSIVQKATGEKPEKKPVAVALGRPGGQKGGPARARKPSAAKRKAIAKKGAAARWKTEGHA